MMFQVSILSPNNCHKCFWGFCCASLSMMNPIVQHVATRAFSYECLRNSRCFPWFHSWKVSFNSVLFLGCLFNVSFGAMELFDSDTLFKLCHNLQVATIVNEGEFRCVNGLSLDSCLHMGLTKSWVDLLPVQMLLVDDCLHSLWQNTKLQW